MKGIALKKIIPGIAWFFVVMFLVFTPGKDMPKSAWLDLINFDKIVHTAVFGILAVLFCFPFHRSAVTASKKLRYFILIAILTSAWGYCTELIQHFWIEGRTYDIVDWTADTIGALLAFLFCWKRFI